MKFCCIFNDVWVGSILYSKLTLLIKVAKLFDILVIFKTLYLNLEFSQNDYKNTSNWSSSNFSSSLRLDCRQDIIKEWLALKHVADTVSSSTTSCMLTILFLHRQYYLPPESMINKDFIKLVLMGSKKLVKMSNLKPINAPAYDEISVKRLYD